jgi:putative tryptophan/tyrosine transport system substrate-binding protein
MVLRAALAATLALVAVGAPFAYAQAPMRIARIAWLSPADAVAGASNLDALRVGLQEIGYVEGRNITIEKRWAGGNTARLSSLAAELVRLKVEVICAASTPAALAAKEATTTIPIVFANVAFPTKTGLVASYARPGGNVTGVAFIGPEYGKRLELLREAAPTLRRVALIYNPDNRAQVLALEETQRWAKALGVTIESHSVRGADDFAGVFNVMAKRRPDALMTTADVFIASHLARIVDFAATHRLLSVYPDKEYVAAGGLMSYGASAPDMYRHAAIYVDRILKGAKPADLPVEQPQKFELAINLKTAKALGLTVPPSLLLRADQVIE